MLDLVMLFSLPKLLFDNELCGQVLELLKPIRVVDDLPTLPLAQALINEQHLVTADHTLRHWQNELYLPDVAYDRTNWERWQAQGKTGFNGTLYCRCRATVSGV